MSIRLEDKFHEDIDMSKLHYEYYTCEDMSVEDKHKTYKCCKDNTCCKDDLCFGYVQIYYGKLPRLVVTTPIMKCPFGIQNQGSSYNLALQFTDLREDSYMNSFYEWMQMIEFSHMKYLGLSDSDVNSYITQIKQDKKGKYDPNLSIKIPFEYNKFVTDIYSDNNPAINLFYVQRFSNIQCDIYIDKIWKYNQQFVCKWKVKCIYVV